MKIFAFGHRSRVGKGTAADFLCGHIRQTTRNKRVIKLAFASKIKSQCHELYAWAGLQDEAFYERPENEKYRDAKLPLIDKTPVEIWVEFGTTVCRAICPDTWVKYPFQIKCDYLIFSDIRFPNEINNVKAYGGHNIKIENPNAPIKNTKADNALEGVNCWDHVIVNDGDLKQFHDRVIAVCAPLL